MKATWRDELLWAYCLANFLIAFLSAFSGVACGCVFLFSPVWNMEIARILLLPSAMFIALAAFIAHSSIVLLKRRRMPFASWLAASALFLCATGLYAFRDGIDFGNSLFLLLYLAMPLAKRHLAEPAPKAP